MGGSLLCGPSLGNGWDYGLSTRMPPSPRRATHPQVAERRMWGYEPPELQTRMHTGARGRQSPASPRTPDPQGPATAGVRRRAGARRLISAEAPPAGEEEARQIKLN